MSRNRRPRVLSAPFAPGLILALLLLYAGCGGALNRTATQAVKPDAPVYYASLLAASDAGGSPVAPADDADLADDSDDDDLSDDNLDFLDDEGPAQPVVLVADPIELFNRAMFTVNDRFYFWLVKPLAKGYNKVAPTPVRKGVDNFFTNLAFPVRFVNCVLQARPDKAQAQLARFFINTTIGGLGFTDVAKRHPKYLLGDGEDLGQTFAKWGVGQGFYLVLPVLGPYTARSGVGYAGDLFLYPHSYVRPWSASLGISAYEHLNGISLSLGDYETLKEAAFDPYTALRNAYIQNRLKKISE